MKLTEAAEQGELSELKSLLAAGADPNERDEDGKPALIRAVEEEQIEAARTLLAHGADANLFSDGGDMALRLAVGFCNLTMAELLLAWGAEINLRDATGETPLFRLEPFVDRSPEDKAQMSDFLREQGLDPHVEEHSPETKKAIFRLLLEHGAEVNLLNEEGTSMLSYAAGTGDLEKVHWLLEAGADPNLCDASGDTPLMWAAEGGNPAVIQRLIEAGANVNARAADIGYTPLIWAAQFGDAAAVKILLAAGANPTVRDSWGQTARDKCPHKPDMAALFESLSVPS